MSEDWIVFKGKHGVSPKTHFFIWNTIIFLGGLGFGFIFWGYS